MKDPIIRPATPEDAAPLTSVVRAAYAPYRDQGLDLPPVEEGLADDIRDNTVFVATIGGGVVGGIVLVEQDGYLGLANLAVGPEAAGHGLGRALIAKAAEVARAKGLPQIRLTSHVDMAGTLAFYRRLGWRETGRDGNRVYMATSPAEENP